jgi:glycosyltransferase involved in cell wall biosynthesis
VQSALEHIEGEIIVVDNNSQDDSCEMMKQRFPNVKLIENKDNSGFPKGNNTGVAIAKGEYIASSILIWLPKILLQSTGFRRKAKDLGIVGVKLIDGGFLPESKRFLRLLSLYKMTGLYKLFPRVKYWVNTMRNS